MLSHSAVGLHAVVLQPATPVHEALCPASQPVASSRSAELERCIVVIDAGAALKGKAAKRARRAAGQAQQPAGESQERSGGGSQQQQQDAVCYPLLWEWQRLHELLEH